MKMKLKFWKKPISDNDSFELFLFFIGNGGSPHHYRVDSYFASFGRVWQNGEMG
jgi:hypothetical protein